MRSTTRIVGSVLAAAVTLGAGGPVAAAGHSDHARPGHVKADKADKAAKGTKGKHEKGDKSRGSQSLRQVLRDIARTDARLLKAVRESRTARIGEHAAAVVANVNADRAALAELVLAVEAPDSTLDLRAVRKDVKDVRAQNYGKVVNDLRHALRLAAAIAEARAVVEGDALAPVAELEAAQVALDAAVAKALLVTASSDKDALRAVKQDLQAGHDAFAVVSDYLGLDSDDEVDEDEDDLDDGEPDEDEPVVTDPTLP